MTILLSSGNINENNSIDATVGIFSMNPPDATVTYTLIAGTGSEGNEFFYIDGNSLKSGIVFDYEERTSYSVRVRSTNQALDFEEEIFTINIADLSDESERLTHFSTMEQGISRRKQFKNVQAERLYCDILALKELDVDPDPLAHRLAIFVKNGDLFYRSYAGIVQIGSSSGIVEATPSVAGIVSIADQSYAGVKSFTNGLKSNSISEYTSESGVTIDGVLLKDGMIPDTAVPKGSSTGVVSSSTSGSDGTANTVSRSDHSHNLGSHSHSGTSDGGLIVAASETQQGAVSVTSQILAGEKSFAGGIKTDTVGDISSGGILCLSGLTVSGNFVVNGTPFISNAEEVLVSDNLLVINNGEVGAGVTALIAGIEVDRGTATNYRFVFDENGTGFRIGEVGNMQMVATREDEPTDGAIPRWNAATNSFESFQVAYGSFVDTVSNQSIGGMKLFTDDIRGDIGLILGENDWTGYIHLHMSNGSTMPPPSDSIHQQLIIGATANGTPTVEGFNFTEPYPGLILSSRTKDISNGDMLFTIKHAETDGDYSVLLGGGFRWNRYTTPLMVLDRAGKLTVGTAVSQIHNIKGSIYLGETPKAALGSGTSYPGIATNCSHIFMGNTTDGSIYFMAGGLYDGNYKTNLTNVAPTRITMSGAGSDASAVFNIRKYWDGDYTVAAGAMVNTMVNLFSIFSDGQVSTTGTLTTPQIYLTDSKTKLTQASTAGALRITTPTGYVNIGPLNSSYCHFQTDITGGFYFYDSLTVLGGIAPGANATYNLGGVSSYWNAAYINSVYASGIDASDIGCSYINASGNNSQYLTNTTGTKTTTAVVIQKSGVSDETAGNAFIQFVAGASGCGQIQSNGANTAAFATYSDRRLKEDIQSLIALDKVCRLNPVTFKFKGKEHTQAGFIAQEFREVFPEYCHTFTNPDDETDTTEYYGITGWDAANAYTVSAIKALKAEVDTLKSEILQLKENLI